MALDYRTESGTIFPAQLFDLKEVGIAVREAIGAPDAPRNQLQLFTDARTVAALNATDEDVKNIFRDANYGLVLSNGTNQNQKAQFIAKQAIEIVVLNHALNKERQKQELIRLYMFVRHGMQRKLPPPNPFAEPLVQTSEPFDVAAALMHAAHAVKQEMANQQVTPQSPSIVSSVRKIFGQR